jgi:hypothetical protein
MGSIVDSRLLAIALFSFPMAAIFPTTAGECAAAQSALLKVTVAVAIFTILTSLSHPLVDAGSQWRTFWPITTN